MRRTAGEKVLDIVIRVLTAAMLAAMVCEALDREEVQGRGQDGDEAHAPNPGASTEGDLYRELGELKAENSMLRVANGLLKRRKKVLDEALTLAVLAQVGVEASEKPDLVKSYPDFRKLVNERKRKYTSIAEREPDTSKEGML